MLNNVYTLYKLLQRVTLFAYLSFFTLLHSINNHFITLIYNESYFKINYPLDSDDMKSSKSNCGISQTAIKPPIHHKKKSLVFLQ